MLTFTNTAVTKDAMVSAIEAHAAADSLVQGYGYWKDGKGCAVGCTLKNFGFETSDHSAYEPAFGIPRVLAHLEDRIFERLPQDDAREWPARFAKAVPIGADLSLVWPRFAIWLLTDETYGVKRFAKERGKIAIQAVADLYARVTAGEEVKTQEWRDAASAAYAAYAASAAYAAYAASAASAAYDAYAASAASAAYAAYAASAAYDAYDAYAAKRREHFQRQADKLIELIKACEPVALAA